MLRGLKQDISLLGGLHLYSSFSHPSVPLETMVKYLVVWSLNYGVFLCHTFPLQMRFKISDTFNLTILYHWRWSSQLILGNEKCNHMLQQIKNTIKKNLLMRFPKMENWEQLYFLGATYFQLTVPLAHITW